MITSELRDEIVWVTIDGALFAEEVANAISPWLTQADLFQGYVTDLRKMTPIPSIAEQKAVEGWRKQNATGKPHALLGQTNALGAIFQIYVRLTKAENTRYFMDSDAAVDWVKNYYRQ